MTEEQQDITEAEVVDQAPSTELVTYQAPARTVDLRERSTDSWTDVVREVAKLSDHVANTDFVPRELRGNAPAIAAAVLYGRELGMPPMTSLQGVAMVKGRPSLYAETMRALILQAGHELHIEEATESRCVIQGRRKGSERWTTATWTMEDARRAGIAGAGSNYGKYPRQMLLARASVELARMIFADVIHGMRGVEEMMDELDAVQGPAPAVAPPAKTTRVQRQTRKQAEPKPKPAESDIPAKDSPADVTPEWTGTIRAEPVTSDEGPKQDTPARKRAELPNRKPASTPDRGSDDDQAGTSAPARPSVEEQQAEIRRLNAQRRELQDQPADGARPDDDQSDEAGAATVETGRATEPRITTKQRSALMGHFGRLSMQQDRDERLLVTNLLLGLEPGTLTSTNDLSTAQAVKLIGIVEKLRDRDALDQILAGQQDLGV